MIITRTGSEIAFDLDDRTVTLDVDAVAATSLSVERVAGGFLVHALVIARAAAAPLRIEAAPVLLQEMHRAVSEALLETATAAPRSARLTVGDPRLW